MSRGNRKRRPPGGSTRQAAVAEASKAERAERDERIWAAAVRRETYRSIAADEGLAVSTVWEIVDRGRKERIYPKVDQARGDSLDLLDLLLTKLLPGIDLGDTKSILAAVKIEDRRAKLLGLDAPTKIQAEIDHPETEAAQALAAAAVARLAAAAGDD